MRVGGGESRDEETQRRAQRGKSVENVEFDTLREETANFDGNLGKNEWK